MTDQIKNRVVGAIVIFAIAIIFLPDILDGKKQQLRDDFETIPVKPQYQSPDLTKVLPVTDSLDTKNISVDNTLVGNSSAPKSPVDAIGSNQISADNNKSTVVVSSAAKPLTKKTSVPIAKVATKNTREKPKQGAWVITVGSFKDPTNVKALLAKLRKNGFTTFSVPNTPRKGETSKVFVGPSFNRASLEKLQSKLKVVINESGFITTYNATEK